MAKKETTKEIAKRELVEINKKAEINEAYFTGLLWSDPFNNYGEFHDIFTMDSFIHDVWGFYFELGRRLYEDGIKQFDEITVKTKVKEYNLVEEFNSFGKMDTIEDAVSIVKGNPANIEYYSETIKKNYTIRQLYLLFGNKVVIEEGKYKWKEMNNEQLAMYWNDKVNKINLGNVARYEIENLFIEAEEYFRLIEEDAEEMLPFYSSYSMNSITQGIPRGTVTMFGGFGNSGKSSIMVEKFVMSCIENKEKMIIVLNEEDAQSFRHKIILSLMKHKHNTGIDRKRMVNNKLQDNDKEKIREALKTMKELMGGDGHEEQIKVVFMDKYIIKDLEKILRFWANRGYVNVLIDTHKVSDESTHDKRWEIFVEDMKSIYRITRKNAGGCNLRTVVTFQLADSAIKNRYLSFDAIGEGKASKNEAGIVMMFRTVWGDEYDGKAKALYVWKNVKVEGKNEYAQEKVKLETGTTYYLLFCPKNRTGANTDNGQPVLVLEPQFNFNHFKEIGWTFVPKDFS